MSLLSHEVCGYRGAGRRVSREAARRVNVHRQPAARIV
ncbi:hypothetical protein BURPSPAST_AA0303 [Burkholderia pseudomallei Pasteur 52237]|nr:hypothetical protein BURPSPAST_AA0303 [Burkholderia pseudomallei Pasteur 52237]